MGSGGCFTDIKTLQKTLQIRLAMYKHNHEEEMSTPAFAQLLSNTLYYRRFFPYYAFNLVAGLDEEGIRVLLMGICVHHSTFSGKGAVYNYDAVGSYQRQVDGYSANGSAVKLIMPLLDNMVTYKSATVCVFAVQRLPSSVCPNARIHFFYKVGWKNREDERQVITADVAVELLKEAFVTAGERDITCGDAVEIVMIKASGMETEIFPLKAD